MRNKRRGMVVAFASWVALACGLMSSFASAHGAVEFPKARQLICYERGGFNWPQDGSGIPNAACREAYQQVQSGGGQGPYQFNQYNEFAANPTNYHDQASVEAAVPDGHLCAAGDPQKSGLDVVSADWERTPVKLQNGHFQLALWASAVHNPSYVMVYLSKPQYSPNRPLRWSDLELVYRGNAPAPQNVAGRQYYFYNVPIPPGRAGPAVLYTRWQREDSGREGFYNCSDIVLEGPGVELPWYDKGEYIKAGFQPTVGEQVRFRVLGHQASGAELVDERLPITAANQSIGKWAQELATNLNSHYAVHVAVGVRNGSQIQYDATHFERNMVFVKNEGDGVSMSIIPKDDVGNPGDYPKWPEGIGQYKPGETIVIGVDNKPWKCKPFPHGAWCNINHAAYKPGSAEAAAAPEDQRAWVRLEGNP